VEIRAETVLTVADVVDAQLAMRPVRRSYLVIAILVAPTVYYVLGAVGAPRMVAMVVGGAAGIALYALRSLLQRPSAARILAGKRTEELRLVFVFDDEGYSVDTSGLSAEFDWGAIHDWHEGRRTIDLLPSSTTMQVIPKRAFSPADLDGLRKLLREHVHRRPIPTALFEGRAFSLWLLIVILFFVFYSFFPRPAH
jgi:hypothetical protein